MTGCPEYLLNARIALLTPMRHTERFALPRVVEFGGEQKTALVGVRVLV